jgi:hypothetical protein
MSDWPKDEEGVLFFRTRQVAEAAAAKCNARRLEPGVRWRVIEHDGKFYVAGFIELGTAIEAEISQKSGPSLRVISELSWQASRGALRSELSCLPR